MTKKKKREIQAQRKKNFVTFATTALKDSETEKSKHKTIVDNNRKMYEAKAVKGNTKRSTVTSKDVMRQINILKPLMVNPFVKPDTICVAKAPTINGQRAGSVSVGLINHQWNEEFDKVNFMRHIASVFPIETMAITKTVWDMKVKEEKENFNGLNEEQLAMLDSQIADNDKVKVDKVTEKNGLYDVQITKTTILKESPKTVICKYDNIFIDPSAETAEDARFIQEEYEMTVSDIKKKSYIYDVKQIDEAVRQAANTSTTMREENGTTNTDHMNPTDESKALMKLTLIDYWGEYDLNNDGIAEQVVCTYVKGTNVVLRFEENPLPIDTHPYDIEWYDPNMGTVYGNGLPEAIEDLVNTRTAFKRGFIDNVSLSNNGQKFFKKGALDAVNYRNLLKGERFIELNYDVKDAFQDGQFNEIPQSMFALYENEKKEIKELTGIDDSLAGNVSATIGRSAGGVSQVMGAARERVSLIIIAITNLLQKIFSKWAIFNSEFIDDGKIIEIAGETVQITKDMLSEEMGKFRIKVVTPAGSQENIAMITNLMQQSKELGQRVPPEVFTALVSEVFTSMGKIEMAEKISTFEQKPDPMQQQMAMLEIEMKKKELQELDSKIALNKAKAYKELGEGVSKELENKIFNTQMPQLPKPGVPSEM